MAQGLDEVMRLLGRAVYEAQETEATLHLTMSVMFGLSPAESIKQLKTVYEKKTMGQFLRLAREKIGLSESFDKIMYETIEQRNFIVHNLSRASVFSIYHEEGREKLTNFLMSFMEQNKKVKLTFAALVEVWMRRISPEYNNAKKLSEIQESEFYQEVEEIYIPQLKAIFGKPQVA